MKISGIILLVLSFTGLIYKYFVPSWEIDNVQIFLGITLLFGYLFYRLSDLVTIRRKLIDLIVKNRIEEFTKKHGIEYKEDEEKK